jgi:predicted nucleotidyltransferase
MALALDLPQQEIAEFCRRHAIRKLALFGSILRNDFRPESDVDVLVDFEPEAHIGWEIVDLQDELAQILKQEVDLHTPLSLSHQFREKVLQTAQVVYERT